MKVADSFVLVPPADLLQKHPKIRSLTNELSLAYEHGDLVEEDFLEELGAMLWQSLECDAEFEAAEKNASPKVLPIVICSDDSTIMQLPWETLYHPKHKHLALSRRFTLSRKFANQDNSEADLEKGPLKVLLFTSLPDYPQHEFSNQHRLNMEEEQIQVLEALSPAINQGKVILEMPDDGRHQSLCDTIEEFEPHVVFLSGHGAYIEQVHSDEPPKAVFEFEAIDGKPEDVAAYDLADAFIGSSVQCVVLSACESAKGSNGLAHELASLGIPSVIGMKESVYDSAGHNFAHIFCKELGKGQLVTTALRKTRQDLAKGNNLPKPFATSKQHAQYYKSQWVLPLLYSNHPTQQLVDWNFIPEPNRCNQLNTTLSKIVLPERFVGRRKELRELQEHIKNNRHHWLITGPGGQGKTALVGKIAQNLSYQGYPVYAWSANEHSKISDFESTLQSDLKDEFAQTYDDKLLSFKDLFEKVQCLLYQLLLQQQKKSDVNSKIVIFLDNLETLQCDQSYKLTSVEVSAWIRAAQSLEQQGLVLLMTSRRCMPDWPEENHWTLNKLNYQDFLQLSQQLKCPQWLFEDKDKTHNLRKLHQSLHGNGRGLTFFINAIATMDEQDAKAFEDSMAKAEEKLQTNMALNAIVKNLDDNDRIVLHRMTAYDSPVPEEGILKLVDAVEDITMEKQTALQSLKRLVQCALIERTGTEDNFEYMCSPVVSDWLYGSSNTVLTCNPLSDAILLVTANYQKHIFETEKANFEQALVVYNAFLKTSELDTAYEFALAYIVGRLDMAGFYHILLDKWLPELQKTQNTQLRGTILGYTGKILTITGDYDTALQCLKQSLQISQTSKNKQGEGTTLNNISLIYDAKGDYDTALQYLKQSLQIRQDIGDKKGEGATLNNIAQIFKVRGDYDTALQYLNQSLQILQTSKDKQGEGITLSNISQIYDAKGDYDTALQYLNQSLQIQQEIGDKQGEGITLSNISQIYDAKGDYDTALQYLKQSLQIQQDIGNKKGEGVALSNISAIYHTKSDYDTALQFLKQSLQIRQDIGDKKGEGTTLNNISQIFKARGDYDTALQYLKQSLQIRQDIGDKQGEGTTLNNISQIYGAKGDYDTALQYLKQSLQIQQDIGDNAGLCATLFNIGHIHRQNEEPQEAVSAWLTVYSMAKPMGFAQALDALENLADHIGLENGLEGWEALLQKTQAQGAKSE